MPRRTSSPFQFRQSPADDDPRKLAVINDEYGGHAFLVLPARRCTLYLGCLSVSDASHALRPSPAGPSGVSLQGCALPNTEAKSRTI